MAQESLGGRLGCALKGGWSETSWNSRCSRKTDGIRWKHLWGKAGTGAETVKACQALSQGIKAAKERVRRAQRQTEAKMKGLTVTPLVRRKSSEVFIDENTQLKV